MRRTIQIMEIIDINSSTTIKNVIVCPRCLGIHIVKIGFSVKLAQRYHCKNKDCNKYFTERKKVNE